MEVIRLSGYDLQEKVKIAEDYILQNCTACYMVVYMIYYDILILCHVTLHDII